MQFVSRGPAFTATQHSVHRCCQKDGTFDLQVLGCAPEVFKLSGLDCCLLCPHFDVLFIGEGGNESASKVFEFIGAVDTAAISFAKADCFEDKLL